MADVELTLTVPSEHVSRILDAFTTTADTHMVLTSRGSSDMPDGSDFDSKWDLRIDSKDVAESNPEFAKRYVLELVKAVVKMTELAVDITRFNDDIAAVDPAAQSVPEDIIT